MRITITNQENHQITLRTLRPTWQNGNIWLTALTGWHDAIGAREQAKDIPQQDGAYWPSRLTAAGRTITISAAADCASSIAFSQLQDRINALSCSQLTILVEDSHGRRTATGWIADNIAYAMLPSERRATFTLILYCPDPLKYGEPQTFTASYGSIAVVNKGTAPSWPRVRVDGRVRMLRLALDDGEVRWEGDADGLDLDFRDMIPSSGTVVKDLAFPIRPGVSNVLVSVSSGARVSMTVRPAWR